MTATSFDEPHRLGELLAAQSEAAALFAAIQSEGLVRAGMSEAALSQEIHALAAERFGVEAHWHKRVVRVGANTMLTYPEDPPDRILQADDICFVDLGPVFGTWEADFARTFVLGDDPVKHRLRDDLGQVFSGLKRVFDTEPDITGADLFAEAERAAKARGWVFGGDIAGHLVGEFPHSQFPGERADSLVAPANTTRMRDPDVDGRKRYWILEVHLMDLGRRFGGFQEELLTTD